MSLKSVYMTSDTKDLAYSKKDVPAIVNACRAHDALVEALDEVYERLMMVASEEDSNQWNDALNFAKIALNAARGES